MLSNKYVLILLWPLFLYIVIHIGRLGIRRGTVSYVNSEYDYHLETKVTLGMALVSIVPILYLAATRGKVADTTQVLYTFSAMPTDAADLPAYFQSLTKDRAFYIAASLIKVFISRNFEVFLFIIAAFQGISLVLFFYRYSQQYLVSLFLFIISAEYYGWMFNGMRQFTAVTIILFAVPFMIRRQYIRTILVILVAAQFHQSALLMIPFVFIAHGKAWNKKTLLFIVLVILAVAYVGQFTTLLDDALDVTQYANVVDDYTMAGDDGTNVLRVLVYSIPALLAFIGRRSIEASRSVLLNFCANMSILTVGIYVVSMVTSGIYIGRIPIYVSLFNYILLPWELDEMFSFSTRKLMYMIMILSYSLFYYVQMHMAWGMF